VLREHEAMNKFKTTATGLRDTSRPLLEVEDAPIVETKEFIMKA
jgi:hypothetical protein